MNNLLKRLLLQNPLMRLGMLSVVLSYSLAANGQALSAPLTGTIQELEQDDGYIVISGVQYGYDREVAELTWQGEEFDDADLEAGMVLRFTVRGRMLATIEVLGPFTSDSLEGRDNH